MQRSKAVRRGARNALNCQTGMARFGTYPTNGAAIVNVWLRRNRPFAGPRSPSLLRQSLRTFETVRTAALNANEEPFVQTGCVIATNGNHLDLIVSIEYWSSPAWRSKAMLPLLIVEWMNRAAVGRCSAVFGSLSRLIGNLISLAATARCTLGSGNQMDGKHDNSE